MAEPNTTKAGARTQLLGNSPWGKPDHQVSLSVGQGAEILRVYTPSHGGYYVPQEHLWKIPANQRAWAAKWSGCENWYEEDCCWAAVALAFPSLFNDNARVMAADLVATYCKETPRPAGYVKAAQFELIKEPFKLV